MNVFEILQDRGFLSTDSEELTRQVTDPKIKEILGKKKVTCYIGFDPTASSLHVGNLLQVMVLAHMQRAGHRPIAIVGGGTGLVGDPSGKSEMRQLLNEERIQANMDSQKKQLAHFLDFSEGKALMLNNADWLTPLNYIEFLRDIGRHFSINHMLTAESVKLRMETGLSFLEFNYSILQAYDFLHLSQNYDCILQMGGSDQWGNICAGTDLIRRVEAEKGSKKKAYGITYPLLTTASGAKMGKTEKGAVWLSDELLSSYEYYQFWRNVEDQDVQKFLGLFTFLPMEEVRCLGKLEGKDINQAKEVLAFEVTKLNHGEEAAKKAQESAKKLFSGGGQAGAIASVEINREDLSAGIPIIELFHRAKLAKSKSEVRRLIQNGGAYLNRERVESIDLQVNLDSLENDEILLQAGKKRFARVVLG